MSEAFGVNSTISQYRIISKIGEGGMGVVYLAEDTRLERHVALKLLPEAFTEDTERLRRFEKEAKAVATLNHPNIITIYEIGHTDDCHFIATEYIYGETLRARLKGTRLSIDEILKVSIQVAEALTTAHQAGIVHRDIKPENIMIRPDGYVKVLDFGLARLHQSSPVTVSIDSEVATAIKSDTEPGVIIGTSEYMSPEQARGIDIDARSDIFSFGILLYEMVTGCKPFSGETASDLLVALIGKEAVPISRYAPDMPNDLQHIIRKAMRKDRDERYQALKGMLIDLRKLKRQLDIEDELIDVSGEVFSYQSDSLQGRGINTSNPRPLLKVSDRTGQPYTSSSNSNSSTFTDYKSILPVALATLVLVAIVGMSYFFFVRQTTTPIAILPFSVEGQDVMLHQLSDDITQHIRNDLSQVSSLRVMSFNSVQRYNSASTDPVSLGRELDVRAVLMGRIFNRDDGMIISVELIDTSDQHLLWGTQRSIKLSDFALVPDEIVDSVSNIMGIRLTEEEKKKKDADALYVKGRNEWNKRTADGLNEAIRYFNQVVGLYPNHARAYAGLADSHNMLVIYGAQSPKEAFPKARLAATKALAIDDTLAEAHAALALTYFRGDWNWSEAEREFRLAISLDDKYASAHQWYSTFLAANARFDEAIIETRKTQELEKTSLIINAHFGNIYFLAHRFDDAISECRKTVELEPNFSPAHRYLGLSYSQKRMFDEAIAEYVNAIASSGGSPLIRAEYAYTLALSGNTNQAQVELDKLIEISKQKYISSYHIAAIYVALGNKDLAFAWLEQAFSERADWMAFLKVDPRFDSLHSDSRFKSLLERMDLI